MNGMENSRVKEFPEGNCVVLLYRSSVTIAIIMTLTCIISIAYKNAIYPDNKVLISFLPSDFVNLFIPLPLLLVAMWLTKKAKTIGIIFWMSALFYIAYLYIPYLLTVPFHLIFLSYLFLVTFSVYSIIGLIVNINHEAMYKRLSKDVPSRVSSIILIALSVFIILRQLTLIVTAYFHHIHVDASEIALWIADFTLACPMLILGGYLLWKRKPIGYVIGSSMLLSYGALSFGIIPHFIIQSNIGNTPIDMEGIFAVGFMAIICFIPFLYFIRSIKRT